MVWVSLFQVLLWLQADTRVGVMKAPYISYSQNQTSIDMMRKIKQMFDPKGLLNPYKYIV
jgi:FAD/FMN-containing dehydrogenase